MMSLKPPTGLARVILGAVLDYASDNERWPTTAQVADGLGLDRTTVRRQLNDLREAGWIEGQGRCKSTIWRCPHACLGYRNGNRLDDPRRTCPGPAPGLHVPSGKTVTRPPGETEVIMQKREGLPPRPINLTGMFSPFYLNGQPVVVEVEGVRFVTVFSTVEKLQEQLPTICPHSPTKIVQVTDGLEFLASVLPHFRVMVDPWTLTVDGKPKTRWTEPIQ